MTPPQEYRVWIVYDGRACAGQGTESALVMSTASSLREARKDCRMFGFTCAIYSGTVKNGVMDDETWVEDYLP
jgi:hypothetical protein